MQGKKVFVGLSGGVDSAVSAALLKREGYAVTGVFITIALPGYPCPAAEDRLSAMRVAAHLDIPFLEIDLSEEYEQEVFKPSLLEWRQGKTPNPDTLCNEKIKFGIFFDWCISKGADYVATGHYAQIKLDNSAKLPGASVRLGRAARSARAREGFAELYMATDPNKDQTYFLWAVPEEKLAKTLFPIGHLQKPEVRALAEKFNLPNAARPDSQGLCFLGDISLDDMLQKEMALTPGEVLNEAGEVVGIHSGAARYTLGQRHGFTLHATAPDTPPHFVVAKDVAANTITVSTERLPHGYTKTRVILKDTNWIGNVEKGPCMARYRYRATLIPAEIAASKTEVLLQEPHFVPAGQSLVLYRGDPLRQSEGEARRCLGGGVIEDVKLE